MVSVRSNDEINAKQIEVKATGASDVKIYANGASQRAGGNDTTDNSIGKIKCKCFHMHAPAENHELLRREGFV